MAETSKSAQTSRSSSKGVYVITRSLLQIRSAISNVFYSLRRTAPFTNFQAYLSPLSPRLQSLLYPTNPSNVNYQTGTSPVNPPYITLQLYQRAFHLRQYQTSLASLSLTVASLAMRWRHVFVRSRRAERNGNPTLLTPATRTEPAEHTPAAELIPPV
jgi:hypothetical protein